MSAPKQSKKYKKTLDHISGTEVGVLVEHFTSQVKFVGEQVSGLNDKFDNLEVKVNRIDARLDNVEVKLDKIDGDVEIIKTDIELIKHDLKNKVGRDEFAILERRVALLENRIS